MSVFDINGNKSKAYDVNGNPLCDSANTSVGYVTDPEYKTVEGSKYRLVWHDEFQGEDIDKNFWTDVQFINTKQNRYQAWSDYYLSDDKLHLLIKKDAPDCFIDDPNNNVAQSIIMSGQHNKLHVTSPAYHDVNPLWNLLIQEGYWEFRFKVWKATGGCHTSIWTVGIQDGENADSPRAEIDVTEILGRSTTDLPHGLHKQADDSCTELYRTTATSVDFATDFHTVGFLWENGLMKWWVDGTLVDTFSSINTPQYPMILILSAYKRISGTGWTGDADTTLGDVEFQLDYVRIYKRATSESSTNVTVSSYTAININATAEDMTIDAERGCPICFPSYVYVNWSDGSRTEHWVKWMPTNPAYDEKMTNEESFSWDGFVYGLGTAISANVNY